MKKMFAAKEGFTLVELIVVIAILGILAAVAVPTYSGYIKKAEDAADTQVLGSINTAARGVAAGKGTTVDKIEVACSADDGKITEIKVTLDDTSKSVTQTEVCQLAFDSTSLPTTAVFGGSYKVGAEMNNDEWTAKDIDSLT